MSFFVFSQRRRSIATHLEVRARAQVLRRKIRRRRPKRTNEVSTNSSEIFQNLFRPTRSRDWNRPDLQSLTRHRRLRFLRDCKQKRFLPKDGWGRRVKEHFWVGECSKNISPLT